MSAVFDYDSAFSRNIGWVTEREQAILRGKRVAIAGLGGVGGSHLLTLTRLGIGAFNLADFDQFSLVNFNRQAGANLTHLNRPKCDVMAEMARDINPELDIQTFPDGVGEFNVRAFLDGVDLYVDGLDFFAVAARSQVFLVCAEIGIPAITAAPLGMGVSMLNFLPEGPSFEDYFRMEDQSQPEQLLRFLIGLSPTQLQMRALVDNTRLDLEQHKGPSTAMGCELCAGTAATQALKILLHRGPVVAVPRALHFDAYYNAWKITWRRGGSAHPLQRLTLRVARRQIGARLDRLARERETVQPPPLKLTPIERVLELARWAPSGDNTQPWRFEFTGECSCVVHGFDTREWCVYDLEGRASQIAVGALLETIVLAASAQGMTAKLQRRPDLPDSAPQIEIQLRNAPGLAVDPLFPFIRERVTQRRPLSTEPLGAADRTRLETCLPESYKVLWIEGAENRKRMAHLLFLNARIRLTIPEAYRVHRHIIQWGARYSNDRIPDQAIGLDPVALKLMRWAMASWDRVRFLNRWLAGTWMPRIQLDYMPGLKCAAHFLLVAEHPPGGIDDYLAAGRALQRFWLTATSVGLQFQPEMTPLIFAGYARNGIEFSVDGRARATAQTLAAHLATLVGEEAITNAVFLGRIGYGAYPRARSTRLSLERLTRLPEETGESAPAGH